MFLLIVPTLWLAVGYYITGASVRRILRVDRQLPSFPLAIFSTAAWPIVLKTIPEYNKALERAPRTLAKDRRIGLVDFHPMLVDYFWPLTIAFNKSATIVR